MKKASAFATLSLLALAVLAAVPVLSQDKPKSPAPPAMGGPEMEAMMKAMSPGEPHRLLAKRVGSWTYTSKLWMDPSQPATESAGTGHAEMILGGRYLQSTWQGNMMGMPFEGREIDGYDNVAKQYVSSWIDNFGTGIMNGTSVCDDGGRKCTLTADMMDPVSGKKMTTRQVTTLTDDSGFTIEMYAPDPSGKEYKTMEIWAKRKP